MPAYDRDAIDSGRMSVPMWDSSDPERAPPPLPIPPGSPGLATRANVSANIQATAQKLTERARENAPASAYTVNPMPPSSDKSLIKGAHHRRMQSLQSGSVRDLRSYLDGMRNGSPERPTSRSTATPSGSPMRAEGEDYLSSPIASTPTPSSRDALKDAPSLRPSASRPRAILGENTPPSATMLALQTMAARDSEPLHDMTNSTPSRTPVPQNWQELVGQIQNLTNISLGLQKEMTQLNRRSKDNATDLVGLKDAANARDEEIRKNLRDLLQSVSISDTGSVFGSRSSGYGLGLLDGKPFNSPPAAPQRPFSTLPRSNSHGSFLDPGSPNPFSMDGAASVAMLEKIIREMVTKDGQERLLSTLSELLDKHSKDNVTAVETAQKVAELSDFIKDKSGSNALVRASPDAQDDEQKVKAVEAMSADILRLLHKIKDSTSQSGGLSNEIKALIQNLRGEVLGMGRELGRQLDQANSTPRIAEDGSQTRADLEEIVGQGLAQLKDQMENMIQHNSQQLVVSGQDENRSREMYDVVRSALTEYGSALVQAQPQSEGLDRSSILEAVKDAIEEFRPEIELQQFGLERDEILQVLKEGLLDYQNTRELPAAPGPNLEEVTSAMEKALQEFNPPRPADEMAAFKEDFLASIRHCIEENKPAEHDSEAQHAIVLAAVKEGLENHGPHAPREFDISRDDLFDAVKASLDGSTLPFGSFGEQVLEQLRNLIDEMKVEFKQYSAANGRDTEQVLDAVKDGLESLRGSVELYVDRAQDVTGKDEIIDIVRGGLEQLRTDVQGYCAEGPTNGRNEMIDYIKAEFEHLHGAIDAMGPREGEEGRPSGTSEILAALESGFAGLKDQVGSRGLLDETNEEVLEAMKAEFESLRDAVIAGSATHKSEVIETIQESLDALHDKVGTRGEDTTDDNDLLMSMKDELAHLRETLAATLLKSGAAAERDEMLEAIREAVDGIRAQITSEQGEANAETLAALKEQLEEFRESTNKGLVLSNGEEEPQEQPLDEIRARLDEIATASSGSGVNTALLEAIQGEFQQLRHTLGSGGNRADTEEILDAVRLGLDDLQSSLEKRIDNPEMHMKLNDDLMDSLNEGLENMRTDVAKIIDKPVDMTVSYEILETLKEGIASLRSDMEKLTGTGDNEPDATGTEIVLAEAPGEEGSRELGSDEKPRSESLKERMEALFAQLHIKVEGLAASIGDMPTGPSGPAEGTALKEDLFGMEETLAHIQDTLAVMADKERAEVENAVTKEDTDAIETLLRNAKAQLDEMPANTASKEQLDEVEGVVRSAKEAIDGLATKEDVTVVEVLVKDLATAFEELKLKQPGEIEEEEEAAPKLTKEDLDALGMLCTEIKEKISELNVPDAETLPSKADIEQITGLINDFRESHDKVKEGYENDIAVTAKAFDDRRQEAEAMTEAISGVKTFLEEIKDEILAKVAEGETGMNTLEETLKAMDEKVGADEGVGADVKELLETVKNEFERAHESLDGIKVEELLETVKNEFERAHESLEGIKVDHEQSSSNLLEKHAEHKDAIVAAVTEKVDNCFDGLMSKYDDAQAAAHEKAKSMEEQVEQQKEMLTSTKEMTDELKLSIDTLGTSLTAFVPSFEEATQKMSEDSKTVFEKVDGAMLKMDENQEGLKTEHQSTRDEIVKVMEAIALLQGDFGEYNPQFSVSLKELHALASAHYEHSQKLAETAEEQAKAVQDQIRAATDESKSHVEGLFAENLKNHFSENLSAQTEELKGALPALLPPPIEPTEKYDDTAVHEKLDQLVNDTAVHEKLDQLISDTAVHEKLDTLVNLAGEAGAATAQMERLDEIHAQVRATAAEVSAFVAIQQKQITEGQESKEREAEELGLLLERRQVQKDTIESDIADLSDEKESLQAVVEALRAEKEALVAQKARLNADVSSLHTALEIRRDELHAMDTKADALERRILEGLIDHSRAMLLTQKTPKTSPKKKPMRDLRLPSDVSTPVSPVHTTPGIHQSHALAMKTRPMVKRSGAAPNTGERRIMSLSQISRNVPSGAAAYATAAPSLVSAQGSINRSQSLKHNKLRKPSWGANRSVAGDKENDAIEEVTEIDSNYGGSRPVSRDSSYRPHSRDYDSRPVSRDSLDSSIYSHSRRSVSYAGTESNYAGHEDDHRTSFGTLGTDETGSYMTGSDIDRRTSFGSTIRSNVGPHSGIEEEEYDSDVEPETPALMEAETPAPVEVVAEGTGKDVALYAPPSDSGLGSDLPTAALSSGGDYFAGAAIPEEEDD